MKPKTIKILYWIFTGLFSFIMLGAAIPDIFSMPLAVAGFKGMGYPLYLTTFLGIAKFLGIVGIIIPGYPRIKEWAYAGLMYDLIGATYSIFSIGARTADWAGMFVPICLGILSYVFYHEKLRTTIPDSKKLKLW